MAGWIESESVAELGRNTQSAEEREQDRLEADRIRRRSALYGLFGLALIGVATVLWALPR